jgi:myo-inositol-1(or 4)-monophosphatase
MTQEINWLQILIQCKKAVKEQIKPLLKTRKQPQREYGIGAGGDQIKQVDLIAENAIINTLQQTNISFTLISEESGIKKCGRNPNKHFVTIDPVDGSTNFSRGIPFYATSLAVSTKPTLNTIHTALVTDLTHDATYTAQKGKGAYCNNKKIAPSKETSLTEAVIGIELHPDKAEETISKLATVIRETKHIRHLGANALELCYVADGTTDAFIDIRGKLRTTDLAAAWLIMNEANAIITTSEGNQLNAKLSPKERVAFIASANLQLQKKILSLIGKKTP